MSTMGIQNPDYSGRSSGGLVAAAMAAQESSASACRRGGARVNINSNKYSDDSTVQHFTLYGAMRGSTSSAFTNGG